MQITYKPDDFRSSFCKIRFEKYTAPMKEGSIIDSTIKFEFIIQIKGKKEKIISEITFSNLFLKNRCSSLCKLKSVIAPKVSADKLPAYCHETSKKTKINLVVIHKIKIKTGWIGMCPIVTAFSKVFSLTISMYSGAS